MELTDLEEDDNIVLEIQWSERPYQIDTMVVGKCEGAILIKPFMYRGTVLDLTSVRFRDMTFNLYGVDKNENTRLVWRNVQIETKEYKGGVYYAVRASMSRRFPLLSERRQNKRMLLDTKGTVIYGEEGRQVEVTLHDVSDNGISFFVPKGQELPEKMIKVDFEDAVRGHGFHLIVDSRLVRRVPKGEEELVGCRITQTNHDFLAYICLKRIEFGVKAKQARLEKINGGQPRQEKPAAENVSQESPAAENVEIGEAF